jgi:hypothetical protein
MALTTLCPHEFASTGDVEAAFRSFMSLKFGHPELPLLLLFLWVSE